MIINIHVHKISQIRTETRKWLDLGAYGPFSQRRRVLGFRGWYIVEKWNIWGNMGVLTEDKGYFSKVCACKLISVNSSSPVIKVILLFLVQGGGRNTLTKKNVCPGFRQIKGGHRTYPASADSQLPSAQNISYTKVAYFCTTRSRPLKQFSDTYFKLWKLLIRRTQDTVLKSSISVTFLLLFVTPGIYLNFSLSS